MISRSLNLITGSTSLASFNYTANKERSNSLDCPHKNDISPLVCVHSNVLIELWNEEICLEYSTIQWSATILD